MTTIDPISYHLERSWHFLSLVDGEVANGELEEAGNKIWGAAAHAIKSRSREERLATRLSCHAGRNRASPD